MSYRNETDWFSVLFGLAMIAFVLLLFIAVIVDQYIRFNGGWQPHYSDGQRSGVVFKISHKGLIYKSWEGVLNLGGGTIDDHGVLVPNYWQFSAENDEVAHAIEAAANSGHRVSLRYHQYAIAPVQFDTDYIVDAVVDESAAGR